MPPSMTAEPGPWRNERTPYLAGLMDATAEPGVEQVVFLKAVQVGFSEATRNLLGYWIDHDPGPCLMVMPSQQAAEEIIEERVRPLLSETPTLRPYVGAARGDNKKQAIRLQTMSLFMGWAGSPQALASRPIRYVLFDEVDKYPPFSGREADPISLGLKRLTTYGHRARAIIGSTPTTRTGNVWRSWERCTDRRHFYVPCPKCEAPQRLLWANVKWPERAGGEERVDQAERIEAGELVEYECGHCSARWTDAEKNAAVRRGEWRSEVPGASNRRVGFHLNSIYSPWVSLSRLAGEFIRAQGDPPALMDFANSRLAEPFEEQSSVVKDDMILAKAGHAGPRGVVPDWAQLLLATADVQKGHLWYVIRAWGHGYRSQLVSFGMAATFDELGRIVFERGCVGPGGAVVYPQALGIDDGYLPAEVHQFAQRDPGRIKPMQGGAQLKAPPIKYRNIKEYGLVAYTVNPNYWKDVLHGLITNEDDTLWLPYAEVGEDYAKQMAGEHKIHDPKAGQWVWEKRTSGIDNHAWDCEYNQCVLAQEMGVASLPSEDEIRKARRVQQEQNKRPQRSGWVHSEKRW